MAKAIFKPNSNGILFCPVCKCEYMPALPAPLNIYIAILKEFQKNHNHCKEIKNANKNTTTKRN